MKTIGQRIAYYRKLRGLSQGALAKACGWSSQSRVGNYETDVRRPSFDDVRAMAKALSVSPAVLMDWQPEEQLETGKEAAITDIEQKPAETSAGLVLKMLAKHGKSLSEETRQKIADAVREGSTPPAPAESNVIHGDFSRSTVVKGDTIVIAQYDVRAAMGAGQVPADYREFVRNLVVDKVQLDDLGLKYTAATNLKIITGWGQSMIGTIDDKSPLIVDIGVTEFVEEGVYVFTWLGHLFVKRVQLLDAEHFQLVSDNKSFEPQKARMEDMHFQARVLGAWNFQRL
ncbi:XRE family transcriptional regulator [Pseudomonas denitrificans (nom. rej.)]|uniref:LexA family transcriptional regulator n=1 Tax=Pseudomonas denitrificans TaxID=43306 RepID=A0A9X7R732_PSEDE|nr:LexA family transcriptional regulator [Pseudomonas denitrificans (nom. rej.)]QEY75129.1 LexA family transcriptional regulator [Pseudomonas denitrificans (nom. rej.)]